MFTWSTLQEEKNVCCEKMSLVFITYMISLLLLNVFPTTGLIRHLIKLDAQSSSSTLTPVRPNFCLPPSGSESNYTNIVHTLVV